MKFGDTDTLPKRECPGSEARDTRRCFKLSQHRDGAFGTLNGDRTLLALTAWAVHRGSLPQAAATQGCPADSAGLALTPVDSQ